MSGVNDYFGRATVNRSLGAMGTAALYVDNWSSTYDPLVGGLELDLNKLVQVNAGYKSGGPWPEVIFKGLVMDSRHGEDAQTRDEAAVRLGTLYKNLSKIPVHTMIYENVTGQVLLETIARYYGKIAVNKHDFSDDGNVTFTKIAVSESSISEAFRRISQACQVWLFEDKTGKLVTKSFPEDRAIDYVLSGEDIRGDIHIVSDIEYYNRVRVVGSYKEIDDFEEVTVYNQIRSFGILGSMYRFYITCRLDRQIQTDKGVTVELYWTTPADPSVDVKVETLMKDKVTLAITRKDDSYFFGLIRFQIILKGYYAPSYVNLSEDDPVPGEGSIARVEGIAEDVEGKATYGANMEFVVDNRYVETEAWAEDVAEFVLKQLKWRRHSLEFTMQYDPRFELGDSLKVPYKGVNWQTYIESMSISWDPRSRALNATLRCPIMGRMEV